MYRKRFRLKKDTETRFQPPSPDNALDKISPGTAGIDMGRKRFLLKKVSIVSNGFETRKPGTEADHSKVSNISGTGEKKPFLDDQGRLRIPLDADDKYRYWSGGQSVFATLLELRASDKEIEAHIGPISTPESWRQWEEIKAERQEGDSNPPA